MASTPPQKKTQTTTAANTAPTSADFTKNTNADTDLSFLASDFPFVDGDAGDSLRAVRIVTLPGSLPRRPEVDQVRRHPGSRDGQPTDRRHRP